MKKIIFTVIALIAISISGYSQSNKTIAKAEKYVDKVNAYIISVDETLALSDNQKTKILKVQIQRIEEHDKLKEEVEDEAKRKELNKPINKKYGTIINREILSKEQFNAFKEGRKNSKKN